MKQSFLNSLKGLSCEEAIKKIQGAGLNCCLVENGHAVSLALYPKTVFAFHDDGKIVNVQVGDDSEVEHDLKRFADLKPGQVFLYQRELTGGRYACLKLYEQMAVNLDLYMAFKPKQDDEVEVLDAAITLERP